MKKISRSQARANAEQKDKLNKNIREGKITKGQAKNKGKGKR